MKGQDELFDFIHALTAAERGYFRKYAALHAGKDTDNLALFSILEKAKEYDEQKAKTLFAKASGKKKTADYNYRRHYLYQMILQSLHDHYGTENVQMDLNVKLNELSILFGKGQYRACDKLLRKVMETAARLENFPVLIQLYHWRQKLMLAAGFQDVSEQDLADIGTAEQDTNRHHGEFLELSQRVNMVLLHHNRIGIAMPMQKNNVLKTHEADLLKGRLSHCSSSPSVRVRAVYHHLLATISFMKQDTSAALRHLKMGMDILLLHTAVYEGEEQRIISWLCNLLTVCIDAGEWTLFDKYLEEMKRYVAQPALALNHKASRDGSFFILLYSLYAAISLDRPDRAGLIADETDVLMARYGKSIDPQNLIQLFVHLAALLVMDRKYNDAYEWLGKLNRLKPAEMRLDIRATARFLEMIIHYEAGNIMVLESVCRSAERQFKALERLSDADKLLLSFFKNQVPKVNSKKEMKTILDKVCGELDSLHAEGKPAVDYIEKAMHHWRKKYGK